MELKTSRIPVLTAYSQLLAEGYFEAWSGSGTFVQVPCPSNGCRPLGATAGLAESSLRPDIGALGFQKACCTVERGLPRTIPVESPSANESYLYQLERSLHIQMVCAQLVWPKRVGVQLKDESTSPVFQRRCTHTERAIGTNRTNPGRKGSQYRTSEPLANSVACPAGLVDSFRIATVKLRPHRAISINGFP